MAQRRTPLDVAVHMIQKINYVWRLFATGFCFAVFGLGGLFISIAVFPWLRFFCASREQERLYARRLVQKLFAVFVGLMQFVGIMRLSVIGRERLRACRGTLVLANHPTFVDVVVLMSLMSVSNCVVKSAVWRNPFMRGSVRATDYVANDGNPQSLIADCGAALQQGDPLLIFPEGTRSVPGRPLKFLRGAAYIALTSGRPVLPVLLHCDPPTLTKGQKWYHIPPRAFHIQVEVRPSIDVSQWVEQGVPPAVAGRQLTEALQRYFERELEKPYGCIEAGDQESDYPILGS